MKQVAVVGVVAAELSPQGDIEDVMQPYVTMDPRETNRGNLERNPLAVEFGGRRAMMKRTRRVRVSATE